MRRRSPELVARALEWGVGDLLLTVTAGEVGFRHALTRDAVLEMTLPPRRTAMSAAALAMVEAANPGPGWPLVRSGCRTGFNGR